MRESRSKTKCTVENFPISWVKKIFVVEKVTYNNIFKKQFSCCPLVWMFCSMKSSSLINNFQKRAPTSTYGHNENKWNYSTKWKPWNENLHTKRNLQILIEKINKIENYYGLSIMHNFFQFYENTFSLRDSQKILTQQ